MRARNIKPGFFTNADLVECDPLARILFAGLWCLADRAGRLEDRPKQIKISILPCDACDADALLSELSSKRLIQRYSVGGRALIQIVNFHKHQKPHVNEVVSELPSIEHVQPSTEPEQPSTTKVVPTRASSLIPDSPSLNADSLIPDSSGANAPPTRAKVSGPPSDAFITEFWKPYPATNCSRATAWIAYRRALSKGVDHETVVRGLAGYLQFLSATDTRPAHPSTWLNEERWDVDYSAAIAEDARRRRQQPASPSSSTLALAALAGTGNPPRRDMFDAGGITLDGQFTSGDGFGVGASVPQLPPRPG